MDKDLHVVMYHYVRQLAGSRYPNIKGMTVDDFRQQIDTLTDTHEMATLESAMDFLAGSYRPSRDLCLLTFDDGLRDHYTDVTPLLAERGIQGVFFLITGALDQRLVAAVHMNHFLLASLPFSEYRAAFQKVAREVNPTSAEIDSVADTRVRATYRWDELPVAQFKYFLNFHLDDQTRAETLAILFERYIGPQSEFGRQLYLNWNDAREMQAEGMMLGGHSHQHRALASLSLDEMSADLQLCRHLLGERLAPQSQWPFSYPYGKRSSFRHETAEEVRGLGFSCAFSTEIGANRPGDDFFVIRRIDCKDAPTRELCSDRSVRPN